MTDINPCHPAEQQARQDELDRLYEADGRHDPAHPQHAIYTGLVGSAAAESEPCCHSGEQQPFVQALQLAKELEKALGEIPESFTDLEAAYSACDSLKALLSQGISKTTTDKEVQ